jgi:hypothetical protein
MDNIVPLKFRQQTNQGQQHLHKLDSLVQTGGNKATHGLELLTFSGNRDTKEDRNSTKHIGATDLLKEMTRRRTANPGLGRRSDHSTLGKKLQERHRSVVAGGCAI